MLPHYLVFLCVIGNVAADICGLDDTLHCQYGCCYGKCCSKKAWSTADVIGLLTGVIFFIIFCCAICCGCSGRLSRFRFINANTASAPVDMTNSIHTISSNVRDGSESQWSGPHHASNQQETKHISTSFPGTSHVAMTDTNNGSSVNANQRALSGVTSPLFSQDQLGLTNPVFDFQHQQQEYPIQVQEH